MNEALEWIANGWKAASPAREWIVAHPLETGAGAGLLALIAVALLVTRGRRPKSPAAPVHSPGSRADSGENADSIFISHSNEDDPVVKTLRQLLEDRGYVVKEDATAFDFNGPFPRFSLEICILPKQK